MNWKKMIGFGLLLWILMFVIVSIFIGFKIYDYFWMKIVTIIMAGLISFILAFLIKPRDARLALTYGLCWVVIGVILDAVVTARFNPLIFSSRSLWVGYAAVLLAPLLTLFLSVPKTPPVSPPPA